MLILSTKLKNAITQHANGMDLTFTLKNIRINGYQKGCSGFIRNNANGSVVYVNTEGTCICPTDYLYRYSDDEKDYRGYMNHYAHSLDELAKAICTSLKSTPQEKREVRI